MTTVSAISMTSTGARFGMEEASTYQPSTVVVRDYYWLRDVFRRYDIQNWQAVDTEYHMVDQSNMLKIIAEDQTDTIPFREHVFDCDDFTLRFKSRVAARYGVNQVGVLDTFQHMQNIIVFPDGTLWAFEPQTDVWEEYRGIPSQTKVEM